MDGCHMGCNVLSETCIKYLILGSDFGRILKVFYNFLRGYQ